MLNIQKIKNPIAINQSNVQGQGCDDDCVEHDKFVGKTNGNTKGCVKYDTIYTPKDSWFF